MRLATQFLFLFVALTLAVACKKEIETVTVPVDKVYSWMQVNRLYGINTVILSMGQDATSLYLHEPSSLGILVPVASRAHPYYSNAALFLPADVHIHLPIASDFMAFPLRGDTLVQLTRPTDPVSTTASVFIHLRQLDRQATGFTNVTTPWLPFGAINRDNFLLFGYHTGTYTDIRLVLAKVSLTAGGQLRAQPQVLTLAQPPGTASSSIRWIVAIDDYFLVNCDAGLYKIREDGSAQRVFAASLTDGCYKWQGALYAVEEYNSILKSTDDGQTWQRYQGTPDAFTFTSYHVIGDSLVGVTHDGGNSLFSLRWTGPNYRLRSLKNDGLGQGSFSGIQQLGDTVYIGTTNGLFKRPLSKFFESK